MKVSDGVTQRRMTCVDVTNQNRLYRLIINHYAYSSLWLGGLFSLYRTNAGPGCA